MISCGEVVWRIQQLAEGGVADTAACGEWCGGYGILPRWCGGYSSLRKVVWRIEQLAEGGVADIRVAGAVRGGYSGSSALHASL